MVIQSKTILLDVHFLPLSTLQSFNETLQFNKTIIQFSHTKPIEIVRKHHQLDRFSSSIGKYFVYIQKTNLYHFPKYPWNKKKISSSDEKNIRPLIRL